MAISSDLDVVRNAARTWSSREFPGGLEGRLSLAERFADEVRVRAPHLRFLLLGEATHGTDEFYRHRAEITRRLVENGAVHAVVVEADWPDAFRVHRYVTGRSDDRDASVALEGFERFPQWMWRNDVVVEFVEWLRDHNKGKSADAKVGFYGMDLYSLYSSIDAILHHLDRVDPTAADRARERYACFEPYAGDTQLYGYAATLGLSRPCEDEATKELCELEARTVEAMRRDGRVTEEEAFFLEQNARLVKNAEAYYRTMFQGRASSWNVRDKHMVDTLEALSVLVARRRPSPCLAVWAHNSHLGDARATTMGELGEWNVGQLVRERHPSECLLVGMTTFDGTVTAASDWDGPAERKTIRPAVDGSYESLFHQTEIPAFIVFPREGDVRALDVLRRPRPERAIGVVYRPQTERASHWFEATLAQQFDAVLHVDRTRALTPLERFPLEETKETYETFPSSL